MSTTDLSRVASSGKLRASVDMRGLGDVDIIGHLRADAAAEDA